MTCPGDIRVLLLFFGLAVLCFGSVGCDDGDGAKSTPTATVTREAATPTHSSSATPVSTETSTVPPPSVTPTSTEISTVPPTVTPTTANGSLAQWQGSADVDGEALLITPLTAIRGSSEYAVVVTTRVRDPTGGALQADAAFRALAGISSEDGDGPVAKFDENPLAPGNPYPDPRLVRADGTIDVPDRHALRGVPDTPETAAARQLLRQTAEEVGRIPGFSTTAPIRIELSAAVDLDTVTPDSVLLFELGSGAEGTWTERVLAAARARGVEPEEVALGFSFPTQVIADDLRSIRELLLERAATGNGRLVLDDPDPFDALHIGVFRPGDPEFRPFSPWFAGQQDVAVVSALLPSPEFRDTGGVFDPAKVAGAAPATDTEIHVLMAVPTTSTTAPRVVIVQHGFTGNNSFVIDIGARLAPYGLATAGISAVSHGQRGNPIELLRATPLQARDIFRQTVADQMALVRALKAGVDLDGDEESDIDSDTLDYLGMSMGGILGAALIAVEDDVRTAVLNVAGGRVAFLGQNPAARAVYTADLAGRVGLPLNSPEFEVFLRRILELAQQGFDSFDGLNLARYWIAEPFSGEARRVLLQEGIGDDWVSNESTEALALAGGLIANTPMSDQAGVSGLWRFEPPGGHFILQRADVFAQAARFLASDGTEIVDP